MDTSTRTIIINCNANIHEFHHHYFSIMRDKILQLGDSYGNGLLVQIQKHPVVFSNFLHLLFIWRNTLICFRWVMGFGLTAAAIGHSTSWPFTFPSAVCSPPSWHRLGRACCSLAKNNGDEGIQKVNELKAINTGVCLSQLWFDLWVSTMDSGIDLYIDEDGSLHKTQDMSDFNLNSHPFLPGN